MSTFWKPSILLIFLSKLLGMESMIKKAAACKWPLFNGWWQMTVHHWCENYPILTSTLLLYKPNFGNAGSFRNWSTLTPMRWTRTKNRKSHHLHCVSAIRKMVIFISCDRVFLLLTPTLYPVSNDKLKFWQTSHKGAATHAGVLRQIFGVVDLSYESSEDRCLGVTTDPIHLWWP